MQEGVEGGENQQLPLTAKCPGQQISIQGNVVRRCVIFSIVSTCETVTVVLSKCDTAPLFVTFCEHYV